jgi:hypothetical protein
MSVTRTIIFLLTLLAGLALAAIEDLDPEKLARDPSRVIIWCAVGAEEKDKCEQFGEAIRENVTAFNFGSDLLANLKNLECLEVFDKSQCMSALDNGKADLVKLDPGEVSEIFVTSHSSPCSR